MDFAQWKESDWRTKIDECFANKSHQSEVLLALYKLVYPNWEDIVSIDGFPTAGRGIAEYIVRKFMAFDRKHHPNVVAGGLWLNNGWSSDEHMDRWSINMETAKVELK